MNPKKVLITQSNYIPWKGYFDAIALADEFIVFDEMQYTKRDWRNRNKIKTAAGTKWISIPVQVSGKYLQKINETEVSDAKWGESHWNLLVQNYKSAPHFLLIKDLLEDLYRAPASILLTEINLSFIQRINEFLGITTKINRSRDFDLLEGKTERLLDLCEKVQATEYLTGPAAKDYMNESLFSSAGISVTYLDYSGYPTYEQLHGDFDHGVSILDLLFNTGAGAPKYMKHIS